jgi:hypothetical protein
VGTCKAGKTNALPLLFLTLLLSGTTTDLAAIFFTLGINKIVPGKEFFSVKARCAFVGFYVSTIFSAHTVSALPFGCIFGCNRNVMRVQQQQAYISLHGHGLEINLQVASGVFAKLLTCK